MQIDEKIYFRESLGIKCSSTQIAYSFLEGRIDESEVFSENDRKICFSDLLLQDEIVRKVIREGSDQAKPFFQRHKFDTFFERYKLFRKIVIRGDDSTASFLVDLDEKAELIARLQKDRQSDRVQLSCWKKNNEDLVASCKNAFQALHSFAAVVETQKRNLDPKTDLYTRYLDILSIIKLLTDDLCKNLQNNIVSATVSDISADNKTVEYINTIDDFRKETEEVLDKRKADLDTLVVSTKLELNDLREELNQEMNKRKEELEQRQTDCEKHIEKLKQEAKTSISVSTDNLIRLMSIAGEFENRIRSDAKRIFSRLNTCKRCYVYPHIPHSALYTSIKECYEEVAPKSVLAIFDCSLRKNGSAGILVSSHAFYLFNGETKKKYQLHRDNEITTEFKKSGLRIFWIIVGIISIIVLPLFIKNVSSDIIYDNLCIGIEVIVILSFLLAFFCNPGDFTVKYRNQSVVTFSGRNAKEFEKFCSGINQLCSSCTLTKEQISQIEKIMF